MSNIPTSSNNMQPLTLSLLMHRETEKFVFAFSQKEASPNFVPHIHKKGSEKNLDNLIQEIVNVEKLFTLARCAEAAGCLTYGDGYSFYDEYKEAHSEQVDWSEFVLPDAKSLASWFYQTEKPSRAQVGDAKKTIESFSLDRLNDQRHDFLIVELMDDWMCFARLLRTVIILEACGLGKEKVEAIHGFVRYLEGMYIMAVMFQIPKPSNYGHMLNRYIESRLDVENNITVQEEDSFYGFSEIIYLGEREPGDDQIKRAAMVLAEQIINLHLVGVHPTLIYGQEIIKTASAASTIYFEILKYIASDHFGLCSRKTCPNIFFSNTKKQTTCSRTCTVQKSQEKAKRKSRSNPTQ